MADRPADERQILHKAITDERARTAARIESLTDDFDEIVASSESVATDDEHDPEGATIAFERQQIASLILLAEQRLGELDVAMEGLADGSYGVCEHCGVAIPMERLLARPTATHCVECASL
jgi:DnaK suppressor protein